MIPLNFLIKPASGACNMRCKYCFYENEVVIRKEDHSVFMTLDTAQLLIYQAFSCIESEKRGEKNTVPISFAFQGGEPTLAGLDFFNKFIEMVQTYNVRKYPVQYTIQTNGLLLNEEWADFFAKNNFLVGISIDGDKALHESLRPDAVGRSTWDRVTRNLRLLQDKHVETNLLCVVTRQCAKHPEKYYRVLKNLVTIPASDCLMIIFILQWDYLPGRVQQAEAVGHILWWKGMEHCIHVIFIA